MKMTPLTSVLLVLLVGRVTSHTLYQWIVDSQTRFNYDPDRNNMLGVYNWPRTYNESCGGIHQSPVEVNTNLVRYGISCHCPEMIYASSVLTGQLKNNGHSPEFKPDSPRSLQLTNVPYRPGTYYMNDFHLHYGGVRGRNFELQGRRFRGSGIMSAGSEHTVDGLRFEGELHFVFYNSKYRNLEHADDKPDGVVVIVILVQKLPPGQTNGVETLKFSQFLETNIPRIYPYKMNASLNVDISMFFNRDCEFYTYMGSTTTPVCHESVRWLILRRPIRVTEEAWFKLTGVQSRGAFNSRFGNYRTTQPLNDRVIEANFMRSSNGPMLPMPNGQVNMMSSNAFRMAVPDLNGNSQRFPNILTSRDGATPIILNRNFRPQNIVRQVQDGRSNNPVFMPSFTAAVPSRSMPMVTYQRFHPYFQTEQMRTRNIQLPIPRAARMRDTKLLPSTVLNQQNRKQHDQQMTSRHMEPYWWRMMNLRRNKFRFFK